MLVVTADEILWKGLEMGGFDYRHQQKVRWETCLRCIRALYGSNPIIYAEIIEDLQMAQIAEAQVYLKTISVYSLLIAMHFLKGYPTEEVRAGQFKVCKKTAWKWGWFYSKKI